MDPAQEADADDLRGAIDAANWFSAQASTNLRYLAAAGIAVVWALAGGRAEGFRSVALSLALLAFLAVMAADFLHYAISASRLGAHVKAIQEGRSPAASPTRLAAPGRFWYAAKMWTLPLAYALLVWAFLGRVFPAVIPAALR